MVKLVVLKLFQLQAGLQIEARPLSINQASIWNPISVDHNSFMEINLYLTLEKSLTVNGVNLVGNDQTFSSTFDMQYKDSWSQTFTCAKCKFILNYTLLEFWIIKIFKSLLSASLERFLSCIRMPSAMRKGEDLQSSNLSKRCRWCSRLRRFFCQGWWMFCW